MKTLLCAKDIEEYESQGKKLIYIDKNTIITPAARDSAKLYGIEFTLEKKQQELTALNSGNCEIDTNMIYSVLKILADKGLLNGVLGNMTEPPYLSEGDSSGFKVVRGHSVKYKEIEGNRNHKVSSQEVIHQEDSPMSAGFFTIEGSSIEWDCKDAETNYVIEGTLTVTINGKTFTANPGDAVYVPPGSKAVLASKDKVKLFYNRYPAK